MLSAFAVIPSPPTTFKVLLAAIVPPPVKPVPAITLTAVGVLPLCLSFFENIEK